MGADYHKVRRHRDPDCTTDSNGSMHQTCTCQALERISQSVDYSALGNSTLTGASKRKQNPNLLSIQMRRLEGKAAVTKEYKSMIAAEYGREKQKLIYETMFSPVSALPLQRDMSIR